jgi:glycosyltransferase involved in cell wall biosynthesis
MSRTNKRTVLFIETTHVAVGGVGVRQVRLAEALPSRGWHPVFALTQGRRFHDPARYQRVLSPFDHFILDGRTGSSDGRRLAVEDVLRKVQPDVVLPGAVLDGWVVAGQRKSVDGFRIVYGLPGIALNSLGFASRHSGIIDAGFGVGPLTEHLLKSYCGLPADRTFLVPTGVPSSIAQASRDVGRPIRLLYVGRFDPDKRALDAITLADELASRGVDFKLTLVGNGLHQPELEAAALRHSGRVVIVSPVPNLMLYEKFFPNADAILLFSPLEGLPNALLEGMAHGLVPITSDFRGRRELGIFRTEETALVFDVGDIRGAARRIEELATRPGLKAAIGGRARQLIEQERSVDRMCDAFVRVLERAVEGPARVATSASISEHGNSRLRRLVGRRAAERVRRLFGLGFDHPDASEWPLIDNLVPDNSAPESERLRSEILEFEASFEQVAEETVA